MSHAIGTRAFIVADCREKSHATGLYGTVTAYEDVEGFPTPVITLDTGGEIRGYECWWNPLPPRRPN